MADAFMVAFRLPNHFRAIVAEGAFNSAFVPTYAAIGEREGEGAANSFHSTILAWSVIANGALLLAALLATGWLIASLAPGLSDDPEQRDLAFALTRITFPYLACIRIPMTDRPRLLGIGVGASLAATIIVELRGPIEARADLLLPDWNAAATLVALGVLFLAIFAIVHGLAEFWNRRRKRR